MSEYIVFWKDGESQRVSTVVDAHNRPVLRDEDYIRENGIDTLEQKYHVLAELEKANGTKWAIEPNLARVALGWDV